MSTGKEHSKRKESKEYRFGKSGFIPESDLDRPKSKNSWKDNCAEIVSHYTQRVKQLDKALAGKNAALEKLKNECETLKRVECDTERLEKEVAAARKDQYAAEAELRNVRRQLSSAREQITVEAKSPPDKPESSTALVDALKGNGQQAMEDSVELLNQYLVEVTEVGPMAPCLS